MLNNINSDEIHVYHISVSKDDTIKSPLELLSDFEISRADRFKNENSRLIFIKGRVWLRKLLSHYIRIPSRDIRIEVSATGKPFINDKLKFNISHSGDLIVFAFCLNNEIGIDTEEINSSIDHLDIGKHVFTETELCYLKNSEDQDQLNNRFYRIWTRKEAVVKAEGTGLHNELRSIDVLNDLIESFSFNIRDIDINAGNKTAVAYSIHHTKLIVEEL